ncbi:MAG: alpha/beta hydrolase [Niabella sp.]
MKVQQLVQNYYMCRFRLLTMFSKKAAADDAFKLFCSPVFKVKYQLSGYLQKAEPLQFAFGKIQTVGYRWNKGGAKKIYIAHGFRSSASNFVHIAKVLVAKGYEVVAFDAPAHGKSKGHTLTALEYKNFIGALDMQYGPFDGYVCHSFGGMAVSFLLAEKPEKEQMRIALIAPASDTKSLMTMFFTKMRITDKSVQKYFIEKIEQLAQKPIEWLTLKRAIPAIKGVVLWVHDMNDKVIPVADAYTVRDIDLKNIKFIFTKELGHRRIYRDEQIVTAVASFL